MRHIRAVALWTIVVAPLLTSCTTPQGAPPGTRYSPYDEQMNPYCGTTGSCEPYRTTPYPLRSNSG
jgi:hypothetical protein